MALDAGGRRLRSRIAVYSSWANTSDPTARTAPARSAFLARFEREVDPAGSLPAEERSRRAEAARRAYYLKLAYASAKARSGRRLRFRVKPVELPDADAAA